MLCARGQVFPRVREQSRSHHRQQDAAQAAGRADQRALGQLFANQGGALRSQGAANRNLLLPCRAPRNQQVRDIQAADQQHAANRPQHHLSGFFTIPGQILIQRTWSNVFVHRIVRILEMKLVLHCAHLRQGVRQAHVGAQSRDHLALMPVVMLQHVRAWHPP